MIVGCDCAISTLIGAAPGGASLHTSQSRGVDGQWNFYASISSGAIHVTSNRQATAMQATTDAIEQFTTARRVAAERLATLSPGATRSILDASNLG